MVAARVFAAGGEGAGAAFDRVAGAVGEVEEDGGDLLAVDLALRWGVG